MPQSLNTRILIAAGVVLAAFLGAAGFVIDHAFRETAMASVHERLKGQIFMLLGLAELDDPSRGVMPEALPDPALSLPESGHYAQIVDEEGHVLWRSRSMLGLAVQFPGEPAAGEFVFEEPISSTDEHLFCVSYTIQWEGRGRGKPTLYSLEACEGRGAYAAQVRNFQRSLWLWFSGLAGFLLLIQTAILRWGLQPLRQVAAEVGAIESGRQTALSGAYPRELRPLTANLNALLAARDTHLARYRNALGDLAHSLKTPLAVIRSTLESDPAAHEVARVLKDHVDQLDATITYQLQRAATAGRSTLGPPLAVAPVIERIVNSLRKVYHARQLTITAEVAPDSRFFGDQGDLMEIIGNVADNACKWARRRVHLSIAPAPAKKGQGRTPLRIRIEDDGPGMPPDQVREAMERGARLDQSTEGHGIGLAVVREIVETGYGGLIDIASSPSGTAVEITLVFD